MTSYSLTGVIRDGVIVLPPNSLVEITQGEDLVISITVINADGTKPTFVRNSSIRFAAKGAVINSEYLFQKEQTVLVYDPEAPGYTNVFLFNFSGAETNALPSGSGVYSCWRMFELGFFIDRDVTTRGSWVGNYGVDGYSFLPNYQQLPTYVKDLTFEGLLEYTWADPTTNPGALFKPGSTDEVAACVYSGNTCQVNVTFNDHLSHFVALYFFDYDALGRAIQVDAASGGQSDTQQVSNFGGGIWLSYNCKNSVSFTLTPTNGNVVLSGVFFDPKSIPDTVRTKLIAATPFKIITDVL